MSHDPWGWAPYHYGRWFYSAPHGWCWFPGPVHSRHYWSPALVGFFGWGSGGGVGVGLGLGWGNVGWVPLAPYETFHRWWGPGYYGRGGYNNVTIVNNTNITNVYRNARMTNAITAVGANSFGRTHITNSNMVRLSEGDLSRVQPGPRSTASRSGTGEFGDVGARLQDREHTPGGRQPAVFLFSTAARCCGACSLRATKAADAGGFEANLRVGTPGRSAAADPGREVAPRGTPDRAPSPRSADQWSRFGTASGGPSPSVSGSASPAVESGRAAPDSGRGWRQLGESPSRSAERQTVPAERSAPAPSGNWRRFGEPSRGGDATEAPAVRSEQALPRSEVPNRGARAAEAGRRFETTPRSGLTQALPAEDGVPSTPNRFASTPRLCGSAVRRRRLHDSRRRAQTSAETEDPPAVGAHRAHQRLRAAGVETARQLRL